MDLSNLSKQESSEKKLFDPIRQTWVSALPEEKVRQSLLQRLCLELGFPKEGIAVEKAFRSLAHLSCPLHEVPDRRADIICFAPKIHPRYLLYPLLLIECKDTPLQQKALEQVIGYNHYVKAYFIAVANQEESRLGYYDKTLRAYRFLSYIPSYSTLLNLLSREGFLL